MLSFLLGKLQGWKAVRLVSITQHSPVPHKDSMKKCDKVAQLRAETDSALAKLAPSLWTPEARNTRLRLSE